MNNSQRPLYTCYSWIPNLTGSLNFEFISDNIIQEDKSYPLYQANSKDSVNTKFFLLEQWKFSDGIKEDKKGLARDIICIVERREENLLVGDFYDITFTPTLKENFDVRQNLNKLKTFIKKGSGLDKDIIQKYLPPHKYISAQAKFSIKRNGRIKIDFFQIPPTIDKKNQNAFMSSNIPLITYRAIKYIFHKDIFHGEEEDGIIGIYSTSAYKKDVLKNITKYLKSYERLIKDTIKSDPLRTWEKSDFFDAILNRGKGIYAYMEAFVYMFGLDKKQYGQKHLFLAKNILESTERQIEESKINNRHYSERKEFKTFSAAFFISSIILFSAWTNHDHIHFKIICGFLAAVIAIITSLFIYYPEVIRKRMFNKYIKTAKNKPEQFIKRKLTNYSHKKYIMSFIWFSLAIVLTVVFLKKTNIISSPFNISVHDFAFPSCFESNESNPTTMH